MNVPVCIRAVAVVIAFTGAAQAQDAVEIALAPSDYILRVEATVDARTVRVSLNQFNEGLLSIGVGNALFDPAAVQNVRLCKDCEPVYFIPVFDASSTYGATTGIIAWSSGEHYWSLSVLPFDLPDVVDPDGDDIYDLVNRSPRSDDVDRYQFDQGLVTLAPK